MQGLLEWMTGTGLLPYIRAVDEALFASAPDEFRAHWPQHPIGLDRDPGLAQALNAPEYLLCHRAQNAFATPWREMLDL